MNKNDAPGTPSERIDRLIAGLDDWRGPALAGIRRVILAAAPDIVEEWKWMGSPVWERDGIVVVCTVLKAKVKLTFPQGAKLSDPAGLFNAGFGGGKWRAIDVTEGASIDGDALAALVRTGIEYNRVLKLQRQAAAAERRRARRA